MRLAIAQTLSQPFAYNAPVVVLEFEVDDNGGMTGKFKDAARPRVFSFEIDGESISYKPFVPGRMDSLNDEAVEYWEEFSAGYAFRVDARTAGKKAQCVKPTAYNCGSACINVNKDCKSSAKDNISKKRIQKLNDLAKSYQKEAKDKYKNNPKSEEAFENYNKFLNTGTRAIKLGNQRQEKAKQLRKERETKGRIVPDANTVRIAKEEKRAVSRKNTNKGTNKFYSNEPIKDYETFKKEIPKELARIAYEYNYASGEKDALIPVARTREELKGRVSDKDFDKWMQQSQSESDSIVLQGGSGDDSKGIKNIFGRVNHNIKFSDKNALEVGRKEIKRKPGQITNKREFEKLVSDTFDKLDKDLDAENLVPVYRLRRALGDKVSRGDFNKMLTEMQAGGKWQLQGGSVEDSATDKIEDSVSTDISGLRTYIKRLLPDKPSNTRRKTAR